MSNFDIERYATTYFQILNIVCESSKRVLNI